MPQQLERACIGLVTDYWFSSSRDPMLRSEEGPGVGRKEFWVDASPAMTGGIPSEIAQLLDPYRNVLVG